VPKDNEKKPTVKIEDLPIPLKDLNPDEQEEVKGGIGILNPSTPSNPNPSLIKKPITDQY
jgi:hypothetical protein